MKCVITGGLGFIGYNLIQRMKDHFDIVVIDNNPYGFVKSIPGVKVIRGDIRNFDLVNGAVDGAKLIIHLAANTGVQLSLDAPYDDCTINVMGTLNMLEAARNNGVENFVFASSGAVLGPCAPPMDESKVPRPISPYGASKLAGEAYCSAFSGSFGIKTVALRFGNVYGPWSRGKTSVIARMIKEAIVKQKWVINGNGAQTRDFIYVDDVVSAIIAAANSDESGVYQIATGQETSINKLAYMLRKKLQTYGLDSNLIHGDELSGDVPRNFADISLAKKALGWKPDVLLTDGLDNTIEWFLRSKHGNKV